MADPNATQIIMARSEEGGEVDGGWNRRRRRRWWFVYQKAESDLLALIDSVESLYSR